MGEYSRKSDFLVPQTNFIVGFGSCFNVFGNYYAYNYSITPEEADRNALELDWRIVGDDIRRAVSSLLPRK